MTNTANPFAGLGNAKQFESGKFLEEGTFVGEVSKVILKKTRKSGEALILEMKIVETSDPKNHPVGSSATWMQKMADLDVAFPAIKGFVSAIVKGINPSVDDETIKAQADALMAAALDKATCGHLGGQNAFDGKRFRLNTVKKLTVKGQAFFAANGRWPTPVEGGVFTNHNFTPYTAAA